MGVEDGFSQLSREALDIRKCLANVEKICSSMSHLVGASYGKFGSSMNNFQSKFIELKKWVVKYMAVLWTLQKRGEVSIWRVIPVE